MAPTSYFTVCRNDAYYGLALCNQDWNRALRNKNPTETVFLRKNGVDIDAVTYPKPRDPMLESPLLGMALILLPFVLLAVLGKPRPSPKVLFREKNTLRVSTHTSCSYKVGVQTDSSWMIAASKTLSKSCCAPTPKKLRFSYLLLFRLKKKRLSTQLLVFVLILFPINIDRCFSSSRDLLDTRTFSPNFRVPPFWSPLHFNTYIHQQALTKEHLADR